MELWDWVILIVALVLLGCLAFWHRLKKRRREPLRTSYQTKKSASTGKGSSQKSSSQPQGPQPSDSFTLGMDPDIASSQPDRGDIRTLQPTVDEPDAKNHAVVQVHFATDRHWQPSDAPESQFGGQRGELRYGTCSVSIPRDHRMGALEKPSIWRLEFRKNPDKHVVLLDLSLSDQAGFFQSVKTKVSESKKQTAFLFIHGYKVSFEDAARRTAQMSYDLGFDGAPVFYSWPSRGSLAAYTVDEQSMEWSTPNLRDFLREFLLYSGAKQIYLIAHSMGNRGLTRALTDLFSENPAYANRIQEIILTAPDIDAEVFKRDIAPVIARQGRPMTLYSSSEDLALVASRKVHGHPRAGDAGDHLLIVPGVETIDATGLDTSFIGHSYYAETRSVLSDLFYLIHEGHRADARFGLIPQERSHHGRYWRFKQ